MKNHQILRLRRSLPSFKEALIWADLPSLEAEILLSHVLGLPRTKLFAHPENKLDHQDWQNFQALVEKRRAHEPIAYLTGHKEFYGLDFKVDSRALIPRSETEDLVLEALKLNPHSVADIGTGCGAIALALSKHLPQAKIYATDISGEALSLAKENAASLHLLDRVQFLPGSLLEPLPEPVDLITANLPYIIKGWIKDLPEEIKDHEPMIALDGGVDGMVWYRQLFKQAPAKLNPGGQILYELDGRTYFWQPAKEPSSK